MFEFFLLFLLFLHESIFFFSKKSYFHSSSSTKKATLENDNKTFRPQDLLHQRVFLYFLFGEIYPDILAVLRSCCSSSIFLTELCFYFVSAGLLHQRIRGFQTHMTKWIEVCGCIITKSRLTGTMAEALIIGLPIII
ncbi:uncharacterized protein LOC114187649 isoform X1 [Vigna unguiculata]|uniref:uncharacterized protein LOC114187649 isoform X1 n=1 Tax=Vigna unguiculata TaxID=3917 RepID=UPI001016C497|nr:uncharacterized protein LOC114187649 isoform X1 [Vigna unguiculata]